VRLSSIRIPVRIGSRPAIRCLPYRISRAKTAAKRIGLFDMEKVAEIADATPSITGLIHELQKERAPRLDSSTPRAVVCDVLRGPRQV